MNGPRINWPSGWVCIPELSLQESTTGVRVAAGWSGGGAVAAEGAVGRAGSWIGQGSAAEQR